MFRGYTACSGTSRNSVPRGKCITVGEVFISPYRTDRTMFCIFSTLKYGENNTRKSYKRCLIYIRLLRPLSSHSMRTDPAAIKLLFDCTAPGPSNRRPKSHRQKRCSSTILRPRFWQTACCTICCLPSCVTQGD